MSAIMRLETSDDPPLGRPDDPAIDGALQRLTDRRIDWVALAADRRHLVSVARGRRGLVVEVARDRVRRCRNELSREQAAAALRAFARGDAEWQLTLPWDDVSNENLWAYLVLLAATLTVAVVLLPRIIAWFRDLGAQ